MEMDYANLNTDWFTTSTDEQEELDDDTHKGSDDNVDVTVATGALADEAKAEVSSDARQCIAACSVWIQRNSGVSASIPNGDILLANCIRIWRQVFHKWRAPCGNRLNVPDLLFVASCFLQVALCTNPADRSFQCTDRSPLVFVRELVVYITSALQNWDREPSVFHTEVRVKLNLCVRVVVFWGSTIRTSRLVDTRLTPEDISLLTMNVNVHQNLDNRARSTDTPAAATILAAPQIGASGVHDDDDDSTSEIVLGEFVRVASRYAFFVSLHGAAQLCNNSPSELVHRRMLTENPTAILSRELVERNVCALREVLRSKRSVTLPDSMRREISYSIWKRMLSVGSIEVDIAMNRFVTMQCVSDVLAHGADYRVAQSEPNHSVNTRTKRGNRIGCSCQGGCR